MLLSNNRSTRRIPDLDLGPRVNDFREEVRSWLAENWKPDHANVDQTIPVNHRLADRDFSRKLGDKGWLSLTWPERWGGQNRSAMEQLVFEEEMAYAEAPIGWHFTSAGMIAPTLIKYGAPEQCSGMIARIAKGDVCFALGYSEPDNGSDLGGIKTAAVRTDKGWTIRGQKLYTSTAGFANYCWLAARTNPQDPRASGISVFIVPLDTKGITIQPLQGLNGHQSNVVFYDDVELPPEALVGEVNGGWKIITAALAHERIALAGIAARARSYFDQLVNYALTASGTGGPMAKDSLVRDTIASLATQIEAARLLAVETARLVGTGSVPAHQAAMLKVYASELMERLAETALDLLGPGASLRPGSNATLIAGRFEYAVRDALLYTIGGGTNEIQRTLIATRGLNLPR
jgi:alkylation response protein AidB-like acyl-CoA dehydrogenase